MKKKTLPQLKKKAWRLLSELIRSENHCCQSCGKTREHWRLEVHHIVPKARGHYFNEDNLIVLCNYCHRWGWHGAWTVEECRQLAINIIGENMYLELHNPEGYTNKRSRSEYEDLIASYKERLEN